MTIFNEIQAQLAHNENECAAPCECQLPNLTDAEIIAILMEIVKAADVAWRSLARTIAWKEEEWDREAGQLYEAMRDFTEDELSDFETRSDYDELALEHSHIEGRSFACTKIRTYVREHASDFHKKCEQIGDNYQ